MKANRVREIWAKGDCVLNGWLSIPSGFSAEVAAKTGFDAVTIDLQHGMIDFEAALAMLQAVSMTDAVPLVRVPDERPAEIMRALDAGAYGIICPMVSTPDQARSLVSSCLYPPLGTRSYGPTRAINAAWPNYFQEANQQVIKLAMIETREGIDNLEAILDVEGLDGVFIGPNDTCLALGAPPVTESTDPRVVEAIDRTLKAAKARGKVAGIYCSGIEGVAQRRREGFDMVNAGSELTNMRAALTSIVGAFRGTDPSAGNGTGY